MKIIPLLYHLSHYTEVAAILQTPLLLVCFASIPYFIPQIFDAPLLFILVVIVAALILLISSSKSAAQGPEAECYKQVLEVKKLTSSGGNKGRSDDQPVKQPPSASSSPRPYSGMSCVVTGASFPGIGFFTAKYLSTLGFRVILLCRDLEKGEAARLKILEDDNFASVRVVIGDLNHLDMIKKQIVPEIIEEAEGTWLALLVNNAGVALGNNSKMVPLTSKSSALVDETLLTNYVGPYLLTELLLPTMLGYFARNDNNDSDTKKREQPSEKDGEVIRPKRWICTQCGKQKNDIHDKHEDNEEKISLYSECDKCGRKTKFEAAKFGDVDKAQKNEDDDEENDNNNNNNNNNNNEGEKNQNSNQQGKNMNEKLKRIRASLGFPRVVNVASLFHIFAQDGPAEELPTTKNESSESTSTIIEKYLSLLFQDNKKNALPKNNNTTTIAKQHPSSYSFSKLCNVMHAVNLARRFAKLRGLVAVSLHPGMVRTKIWKIIPSAIFHGIVGYLFFKTPENGAQTSLHCCTIPMRKWHDIYDLESTNGKYYADCAECAFPYGSPACSNEELDKLEDWTRQILKDYLC